MTFAGKYVFGSTDSTRQQQFLTSFRSIDRHDYYPGMAAAAPEDPVTTCILDDVGGGSRIQLLSQGSWKYLTVGRLGWIVFAADPAEAAVFQVSRPGHAQTWTVMSGGTQVGVGYTLDDPPLLTINSNPDQTFDARQITPPLSVILRSKSGAGMDFSAVDLSGQQLDGIDFTGANFAAADLGSTSFKGCLLSAARFDGATLAGASFDGATLDGASFRGSRTDLSQVQWGRVKSALRIDFSSCRARGTRFGGAAVDCSGANLSGADFSGADLSYLNLSGCNAANAILAEGCDCSHVLFDDAALSNVAAARGKFAFASMRRVNGSGAAFISADLSDADLTQAQFGAKDFLFAIDESLAAQFDGNAFVTPDIMTAFQTNGRTLSPLAAIEPLSRGASWRVMDPKIGRFSVINGAARTALDVFAIGTVRAAVFTAARMDRLTASSAGLAAVDLTGVAWGAGKADHADLETAVLANALLVETDFTQAQVFGTNFVGSVLIQARLNGCTIGPGEDGQPTNFSQAQMQGTQFAGATFFDVLLGGAAVALPQGVPLFVMPLSYEPDLTPEGLPAVRDYFAQAGYPLGASASIAAQRAWSIDNSSDPQPNAVTAFLVWDKTTHLAVYDASSNGFLFALAETLLPFLQQSSPSPQLIGAFATNSYDLAASAALAPAPFWQITNSQDGSSPVTYQYIKVIKQPDGLHVYGATTLWLAGRAQLAAAVAFGSTFNIRAALNPTSICPSGYPRAVFDEGMLTWEQLMTVNVAPGV
jgi:uncharacterized protein YjbI with pentapeptide repeats